MKYFYEIVSWGLTFKYTHAARRQEFRTLIKSRREQGHGVQRLTDAKTSTCGVSAVRPTADEREVFCSLAARWTTFPEWLLTADGVAPPSAQFDCIAYLDSCGIMGATPRRSAADRPALAARVSASPVIAWPV